MIEIKLNADFYFSGCDYKYFKTTSQYKNVLVFNLPILFLYNVRFFKFN